MRLYNDPRADSWNASGLYGRNGCPRRPVTNALGVPCVLKTRPLPCAVADDSRAQQSSPLTIYNTLYNNNVIICIHRKGSIASPVARVLPTL